MAGARSLVALLGGKPRRTRGRFRLLTKRLWLKVYTFKVHNCQWNGGWLATFTRGPFGAPRVEYTAGIYDAHSWVASLDRKIRVFVFVAWFPDSGLLAYGLGSSTSEQWVVGRQETIQRSVTAVVWLVGYDSLSSGYFGGWAGHVCLSTIYEVCLFVRSWSDWQSNLIIPGDVYRCDQCELIVFET